MPNINHKPHRKKYLKIKDNSMAFVSMLKRKLLFKPEENEYLQHSKLISYDD